MEKHQNLINELKKEGFEVLDINKSSKNMKPLKKGQNFGIDEGFKASKFVNSNEV